MATQSAGRRTQSVSRYQDMFFLPHPEPKKHPRMQRIQRAAQFAPFAALSGYGEMLEQLL